MNPTVTVCLLLPLAACGGAPQAAPQAALQAAANVEPTAAVGTYPPPPAGLVRARIGIPAFALRGEAAPADTAHVAADQLFALTVNSMRFDVIERAQLDPRLGEQALGALVLGAGLAGIAQAGDVEYLLFGEITGLRVRRAATDSACQPLDGDKEDPAPSLRLRVEGGVGLRIVDPTTGEIAVAQFSDFARQGNLDASGVQILGAEASEDGDITVSAADHDGLVRLALDDCLRKMLPRVDALLSARRLTGPSVASR